MEDTSKLLQSLNFLKERAELSLAITEFGTEGKIEDAYKLLNDYINSQQQKQKDGKRN